MKESGEGSTGASLNNNFDCDQDINDNNFNFIKNSKAFKSNLNLKKKNGDRHEHNQIMEVILEESELED